MVPVANDRAESLRTRAVKGAAMPTFSNMALYYRASCPFCRRVLSFMRDNDIELELRDTTNPDTRAELARIGGKPQVPCLLIAGKPMYESADIIAYLGEQL